VHVQLLLLLLLHSTTTTTLLRHKNTPKFNDHNLKVDYWIFIMLGTTIPNTTCHQTII